MLRSAGAIFLLLGTASCSVPHIPGEAEREILERTVALVQDVKEYGKTLGIKPTKALSQSTLERRAHSMLWLWLQKRGTLALRTPIDIRIWLRFSTAKELIPLERLFNISGYSVYFRQGNQFGDARSVTTVDFAKQSLVTKVTVILHEDLHDAENFDLPWEIEESLVTPLAKLAALKYFEYKGDRASIQELLANIAEERGLSRELNAIVAGAERLFQTQLLPEARDRVKQLIRSSPAYSRYYQYQISDQDPDVALEAKLSHDFVYYSNYERIVSLYDKLGDLKALIDDFKKISPDGAPAALEKAFQDRETR